MTSKDVPDTFSPPEEDKERDKTVTESTNESKDTGKKSPDGADELALLRPSEYVEPVEELIGLLSQSKRAFLLGAGCSKPAGLPDMEGLSKSVLDGIQENEKAHSILDQIAKCFGEGKGCTIEDYMSELVDLIAIADRREHRGCGRTHVPVGDKTYSATELREALTMVKRGIEKAILSRKVEIHGHRQFIRAVHGRLQSGKAGSSHPVDYFTLNYDTLLEDALSLERIPIADGFNGGATGWWNIDAYSDQRVIARVLKVHGSVDWCLLDSDLLPRRVRHGLKDDKEREPVLIWPAATKYREAQRDPFAQMLNIMRQTLRPPDKSQVVLAVVGYSFGDFHVNEELDRALVESDGRLTIVAFTGADKIDGILEKWRTDSSLKERVRIYAKRGFYHGGGKLESNTDLPWWKFEVLGRLLGGER